ncbi:hypothetical protein G6F55_006358 [Rhizopus delemar]|uniref:NUA/TPR/MLP1-2-like domain-containing protein n=2 Tax=Rhizopus TaxID=4842 RepID=A0A9P6Z115_9FUNG|nr:hypothetical protein G6F55_006358 [Rhizopus delemar]KAG1552488.1 hypothetical protein G6F51_001194 [Rhizopus arrhizus]KAG1568259.1 hypothetical protein G6F50_007458 [Rhizopus delemar]KAG1627859.1 hypothetical protein G6F45_007346 [Rhizopus arrhizus]
MSNNADSIALKQHKIRNMLQENYMLQQKIMAYVLREAKLESDNSSLKEVNEDLKKKLESKETEREIFGNRYATLEKEYEQYRYKSNSKMNELQAKTVCLEDEKRKITSDLNSLQLQYDASTTIITRTKHDFEEAKKEKDESKLQAARLETSYRALNSTHTSFVEQHNKTMLENKEKIQELSNQNSQLKDEIEQLKDKLQQEQEQSAELKKIIPSSSQNESRSRLLELINKYQKEGKQPEEVYKDYFEISNKFQALVTQAENSTKVTDQLRRELYNERSLYNSTRQEIQNYKQQLSNSQQSIKKHEASYQELVKNINKIKADYSELAAEKKKIEATLKDTSYQLQYLLTDIQKSQASIPSETTESLKHLSETSITPNLEHDELVFRNVSELQDLNRNLSEQLRALKEELATTKNIANDFVNENHSKTLSEAKEMIVKLDQQLTEKQQQLESLQQELDQHKNTKNQKEAVSESSDALDTCLSQLKETTDMFATYRAETTMEVDKLKSELYDSRISENETKNELLSIRVEVAHLKQQSESLNRVIQQREQELTNARHESISTNEQLIKKEQQMKEINDSLIECKATIKQLKKDNMVLRCQLEAKSEICELIKKEIDEINTERLRLSRLLNGINSYVEGLYSSSTETVNLSKGQIERISTELRSCHEVNASLKKDIGLTKDIQDKYEEALGQIQSLKEKLAELESKFSTANQEKIVAETKLSEAEENLKKLTNTDTAGDTVTSSCEQHIQSIAELKDRIRILEDEKKECILTAENASKKAAEISNEHKKYIEDANAKIEKLTEDLDAHKETRSKSHQIFQEAKEQYDALRAKLENTQNEQVSENQTLKSDKVNLEHEIEQKKQQLEELNALAEEQKKSYDEVQDRLNKEIKAREQVEETVSKLRADMTVLESELNDNKQKLEEAKKELVSKEEAYKHETSVWTEFQENTQRLREEAEKSANVINSQMDELFEKLSKWNESNESSEIPNLTQEIYTQLRESNLKLCHEKEIADAKYLEECRKYKLLEQELEVIKHQLDTTRETIKELEKANNTLSEQKSTDVSRYKLEAEAYKSQNISLMENENQWKTKIEKVELQLVDRTKEFESVTSKIAVLESQLKRAQDQIIAKEKENAEVLSKQNQVDTKEVERMKAENETLKAELESAKADLQNIKSSTIPLNDKIKSLEAELETTRSNQAGLVSNANQRQRIALELKNRLTEANKKNAELESTVANLQKQVKEASSTASKNTTASDGQKVKTLEEALKKEQEARQTAEQEIKDAGVSLKTKSEEYTALENKFLEELKALRIKQESEAKKDGESNNYANPAEITALKEKITALEAEVERLKKEQIESEIEISRLKVMNSMTQNKNKRLQNELTALKNATAAATSTTETNQDAAGKASEKEHVNVQKAVAETPIQPLKEQSAEQTNEKRTDEVVTPSASETVVKGTLEAKDTPPIETSVIGVKHEREEEEQPGSPGKKPKSL